MLTREYITLFRGITETVGELEALVERLKDLQRQAEEECISDLDEDMPTSA